MYVELDDVKRLLGTSRRPRRRGTSRSCAGPSPRTEAGRRRTPDGRSVDQRSPSSSRDQRPGDRHCQVLPERPPLTLQASPDVTPVPTGQATPVPTVPPRPVPDRTAGPTGDAGESPLRRGAADPGRPHPAGTHPLGVGGADPGRGAGTGRRARGHRQVAVVRLAGRPTHPRSPARHPPRQPGRGGLRRGGGFLGAHHRATTPKTTSTVTATSSTSGYGATSPSRAAARPPPTCSKYGQRAGFSRDQLKRAKKRLRITAAKPGSWWAWQLRPTPQASEKGAPDHACLLPCSLRGQKGGTVLP